MDFLLDPNIAYIVLVAAFLLAFMAVLIPGTGVVEVITLFAMILAGYAAFRLPVNGWALVVLLLAVIPFFFSVRKPGKGYFLALSILALVVGSAFLFKGKGWFPAVNPVLALLTSTLVAVFLWIVSRKAVEAFSRPAAHNIDRLIGEVGEATTEIYREGSIQLESELWSADSTEPIPAGSRVRVIGREGFILHVQKL